MAKSKTKFICHSCGYESAKWMGKCPARGLEYNGGRNHKKAPANRRAAFSHSVQTVQKPSPITSIETSEEPRVHTKLEEFNRVLGGGVVKGSLVLIGGDPGSENQRSFSKYPHN